MHVARQDTRIACGSAWFGARKVGEGYDGGVPEMAELCGESVPYRTGWGGQEYLEFVDERQIVVHVLRVAHWHETSWPGMTSLMRMSMVDRLTNAGVLE